MSEYICFSCSKTLRDDQLRKRIRCIYCGSKIIFKKRSITTKVDAI